MGWNRDKAKDLIETRKVLKGDRSPVSNGQDWLGHKIGKKDFAVTQLLVKGASDAALQKARPSWRGHIIHLRDEHGLGVERDERGYWRFTGESAGERKHTKTPISDAQYRAGYVWGRKVALEDLDEVDAVAELVALGINETSASYMLVVAEGLLTGTIFKRALKEEAYGWYLGWILDDFGPEALRTALLAARLHLEYRESDGNTLSRFRADIERFERLLDGKELVKSRAPVDDEDSRRAKEARERWVKVLARYGQPEFRRKLLEAYGGRCAVTGTAIERVLEAAHVKPYASEGESRVSNGLLLRSDIHALFDAYLLSIDPKTYKIKVSNTLRDVEEYWKLDGRDLFKPSSRGLYPNAEELAAHFEKLV
jgi:hypothetical protein